MEKARWASKAVRILGGQKVHLLTSVFDQASYRLEVAESMVTGSTGLLNLFTLRARSVGLPDFSARWDDSASTVDVDLIGPSEERDAFKAGRVGYRGHHSVLLSRDPRQYKIEIATPDRLVLVGYLSLNLAVGVKVAPLHAIFGLGCDAELIEAAGDLDEEREA